MINRDILPAPPGPQTSANVSPSIGLREEVVIMCDAAGPGQPGPAGQS